MQKFKLKTLGMVLKHKKKNGKYGQRAVNVIKDNKNNR